MKLNTMERSAKYHKDILQRYKSLAGFAIYAYAPDMCFAHDMPCGALGDLYHIANEPCEFISHFTK